eukprot:GHRR01011763.1.p1 GENE.GHRR01011763.1~~GHRR01011763.1.p1  ORF type:complete len:108 (+),score=10.22 GHRR01011763.1:632-955(+)
MAQTKGGAAVLIEYTLCLWDTTAPNINLMMSAIMQRPTPVLLLPAPKPYLLCFQHHKACPLSVLLCNLLHLNCLCELSTKTEVCNGDIFQHDAEVSCTHCEAVANRM